MAARLVLYRGKVPDAIRAKIDDTIGRTMYLVQTTGPTNYIQEQNSSTKYRVLIGAVQSCTCGDKDVCCHLLFVMLKILRVPRTNPVVWQKSLIDSEITTLLSGGYSEETNARAKPAFLRRKLAPETPEVDETTKKQVATRHALVEGEVCAICQEEMVESEKNLTYCKHGCGNNFHIDCMKVFGESRKQSKEPISCPLCRHDWGDSALTELKKEADISNRNPLVHTGTTCKQCQTKPIRCNRYRCLQCKHTDLCERCFKSNAHAKHSFVLRKTHKGTWFPALRSLRDALLSPQAINDLEGRELSHADYDLLCELDAAEKYPLQDYLMANLVGDKLGAAQAKAWTPASPDVSNWSRLAQAQVTRDLNRAQSQDRKRRQKVALVERKLQHAPGLSSLLPLQLGPLATTIDEPSRQERIAQAKLEKQIKVKAERERKHELAKSRRQEQVDHEGCPLSLLG
ncbi:hypothetical protein SDRG_09333 [Saprolegnia diclina VS20]|uniref:RING-type domain-containing protein n=1 Tax=Saprolegnia diclina (strain VS20) TaxID=1156394 RepID=T0RSY6_SAPDV|nr:hypothetical protein SDRG_09333 [Saprolegnia diclina VS20]EQC33357.1 hypothetical protein SDRG_09333 [Saprolegnia diclina VS20]|eukprot:XP_008613480.1 hypothetical protein SDRG_09333 [Saprolegnia diclina VS20]